MKTLAGIMAGITVSILWHLLGWPWIGWVFTRILPDAQSQPRHRNWTHGVEEP